MKPVGGYFDLTLSCVNSLPDKALLLNTGRNSLEYILRARKYKKLYMPYYTCGVLQEPIRKLNLEVEYYNLNDLLEPEMDYSRVSENEGFLYTNYFSLKDEFIESLSKAGRNLIIDNAQSFYSEPISGVDTFYSPRKYFGLPDGAYLYTDARLNNALQQDISFDRMLHLLKRTDVGAEQGFADFLESEKSLNNQEIKTMSAVTQKLMSSMPLHESKITRQENFKFLHKHFKDRNRLDPGLLAVDGTFCYPLLLSNGNYVKEKLIENKIFVPTFWKEVIGYVPNKSVEWSLVTNLVCLPIDQRYGEKEMNVIVSTIESIGE